MGITFSAPTFGFEYAMRDTAPVLSCFSGALTEHLALTAPKSQVWQSRLRFFSSMTSHTINHSPFIWDSTLFGMPMSPHIIFTSYPVVPIGLPHRTNLCARRSASKMQSSQALGSDCCSFRTFSYSGKSNSIARRSKSVM